MSEPTGLLDEHVDRLGPAVAQAVGLEIGEDLGPGAAERFQVAWPTAKRWADRYRELGTIAAQWAAQSTEADLILITRVLG